jgi:integrase
MQAATEEEKVHNAPEIPDVRPPRISRRRHRGQAGSVLKRGFGYTIVYRVNGKQTWQSGFATKKEAQDRLTIVLASIGANTYVEPKQVSLETFVNDWMTASKATLKPKTWASYQSALDVWILPKFGQWLLPDIGRGAVGAFKAELIAAISTTTERPLSRKSVRNTMRLLHNILEEAVDREYIAVNPARERKRNGDKEQRPEHEMPTPAEVVATFAGLPAMYQALLYTGAVTGFRRAELLGLKWDDVDWLNGSIRVRRTLQRIPKELLESGKFRNIERIGNTGLALLPPKSIGASRTVEMPAKLEALLRSLRDPGNSSGSSFVFRNPAGDPIDPDAVYDVLHEAQDKAKVKRFGLHSLRHLYASLLMANHADVKFAQKKLGHASATTTLDIYSHSISERGHALAAAVDAAFPSVSTLLAKQEDEESEPEVRT